LDTIVLQASPESMTGPTARQDPSLPQVFGRYLLVQRLSRGGMGEIFLAKHGLAGFEKLAVIKKVLPHLSADAQFISRFVDEAQVAIKLVMFGALIVASAPTIAHLAANAAHAGGLAPMAGGYTVIYAALSGFSVIASSACPSIWRCSSGASSRTVSPMRTAAPATTAR